MGNYDPLFDDILKLQINFLIIDDVISTHLKYINFNASAEFNSQSMVTNISQQVQINRSGNEAPFLIINASFLNSTATSFGSG